MSEPNSLILIMQSITLAHAFLFLSIIATIFLFRERKFHIVGIISISICLLFIDLPDIDEYRTHYDLTGRAGFDYVISLYNFEPGYVIFVAALSSFLPFEAFYVITISLAIHAYLKFFEESDGKRHYIYAAFFLSICLYFTAFTLRTTLASTFLAYAILCLKSNKNAAAGALILVGGMFHVVLTPLIILPVFNRFSSLIAKHYILLYIVVVALSVIVTPSLSLTPFLGANEVIDLKISSYEEANFSSNSYYFGLWLIAFIGALISYKNFSNFDRMLVISLLTSILFLYPFEFIQGRFMWLTSFLFAYIFSKGTFLRFNFGDAGRIFLVTALPLAVFFRI